MKTFTILGTGWLGYALAKSLKNSFKVKVSIKDELKKEQLLSEGFTPYILNENEFSNLNELLDTDYLFINYPPTKFENYLQFLNRIYENEKIKTIKKIFFISSTSIYPNISENFKEEFVITKPISKSVFEAEELVKNKTHLIFRCSGLMGYDRVAGKYFANRSLDSEDIKVNYVHRDDVIEAVKFAIQKDLSGIFNLCPQNHPTRKEVYLRNAKKYGFDKPIFENKKKYPERIIDGSKIEKLGFAYKYNDPMKY